MKKTIILLAALVVATAAISAKGECKADVQKFCPSVKKTDKNGIRECVKAHYGEFSQGCKSEITHNLEKNNAVRKACKADYKKLCSATKAGKGRIIACLKSKEAELSEACKTALNSGHTP